MPQPLTPRADLPSPTEGDDYTYAVSFTDRSGSPIDITGWTVSMTVAEDDGTAIIEKDITTHDDATGGKTSWSVPASDTSGLSDTKRYDIQVVKSDGTTRTVVIGTIAFTDGVTDRTISGSGGSGAGASAGASIDVTLDGDDSVAINVRGLTNYTDSDVLNAIDGQSISPGELSVGQTGPVTGIVGDSGEYIVYDSQRFPIGAVSTTSTSYDRLTNNSNEIFIDINEVENLTGISTAAVQLSAQINPDTAGETATLSLGDLNTPLTGTEISTTGGLGREVSTITDLSVGKTVLSLQGKVTAGSMDVKMASMKVLGKIA